MSTIDPGPPEPVNPDPDAGQLLSQDEVVPRAIINYIYALEGQPAPDPITHIHDMTDQINNWADAKRA